MWFKCPRCQRENIQRLARNERQNTNTAQNKWAAAVKFRDGGKCVICGATVDLHAHHIVPKEFNAGLRYDVSNGVTLCREHHSQVHRYDCERRALLRRACAYLKANNTTDESAKLLDDIVAFGRMLEMEREANL